ncbi:MAG: DUF4396 domain-containing protein [Actinomycetota bacterium]|nr:DUF4396 domain-containing protein [Actinomycetota bacterium]
MLTGVVLLWFIQVVLAVAFVAFDIRRTPEATVMKWGFVLFTAYTGLFGALLYVLSCREPLADSHERYVAARWRQVVGSTMHCVAGDGLGILVAAAALAPLHLPPAVDLGVEYVVGFGFGWTIFQALFMRDMAGSYRRSLRNTFLPEMVSMNGVMAAMAAVSVPWKGSVPAATRPLSLDFWFVMSIALCAGFLVSYPINWWLVARGLKHGMKTVTAATAPALAADHIPSGVTVAQTGSHPAHPGPSIAAAAPASTVTTEPDRPTAADMPMRPAGPSTRQSTPEPAMSAAQPHPAGPSRLELVTVIALSLIVLAAGVALAGLTGSLLGA